MFVIGLVKFSVNFKFLMSFYIIFFIRMFLTFEGIVEKVDLNFNIYIVVLLYVI